MHYIAPSVDESTYYDLYAAHRVAYEVAHDPNIADLIDGTPQYSDLFGSALLRLRGGVSLDISDSLYGVTVRVLVGRIEMEDERTTIEPNMDDPFRRDAFIAHRLRRIITEHADTQV